MGSLSWLRLARRIPGLSKQPEFPSLEAFLEAQASQAADEYHIARWVVPLVLSVVGIGAFTPLGIVISPMFFLGLAGMLGLGAILGWAFHRVAKGIPGSRIKLTKRSKRLLERLLRLRSLLGIEPALSSKVGMVLDEAAMIYFRVCPPRTEGEAAEGVWTDAKSKAMRAMEEAMGRMLELAEPESALAQEVALGAGWVEPLLMEMRALADAVAKHERVERTALAGGPDLSALAGLQEARSDLERIDVAITELEQRQASGHDA